MESQRLAGMACLRRKGQIRKEASDDGDLPVRQSAAA